MFLPVLKDVDQSGPNLARRPERTCVIAVSPHGTASSERPVDCARGTDLQRGDTLRQADAIISFDDQVHVIALHGEM
jgi:hypothetical protein